MELFIDTAKIDEIEKALEWGILDGVTTNPTKMAEAGMKFSETVEKICKLAGDLPVSVEAVSLDAGEILAEAKGLCECSGNIVVKVPLIEEGIKAISKLSKDGIKTNVTLNFSANQALLAAKAGATYISPFVGRLDGIGTDGMELVREIRQIYDNYGFETKIIVAAARHPMHVQEAALIGADVCTMTYEIMEMLFEHPLTDAGLEKFLQDWEKVPK